MPSANWMLYGANGYTGVLIAEEAVRRGHKPILAGRSAQKLQPIAERLGLPFVAVDLHETAKLREEVARVGAVLHAAGPFIHTAEPMRRACLDAGAHYLDITGEIAVFQGSFALDAEAKQRKVAIISGVGFDVVPTDCLAKHVADQLPGAVNLEIAFAASGGASAGTTKSAIEHAPQGNAVRRNGRLERAPFGRGIKRIRFSSRPAYVMPIPWGDLETAFHSTGVPKITTSIAIPSRTAKLLERGWPVMNAAMTVGRKLLESERIRSAAMSWVDRKVKGPDEQTRETARSYVWARAEDASGKSVEAWLDTLEGYKFTAVASVLAVDRVLKSSLAGALTPSLAFGADFVLGVPSTQRLDSLG